MAKHTYRVTAEAAVAWAGAEVGDEVELDLQPGEKTAVLAAGWVEEVKKKGGDK